MHTKQPAEGRRSHLAGPATGTPEREGSSADARGGRLPLVMPGSNAEIAEPEPRPSPDAPLREPASASPPPRPKRAEKSAARREAILAAAFDEFTERGFAATRIDDVARRAGVGKGTIYLHFRDKEALFQHLVTATLGPLIADIEKIPDCDLPIRTVMERLSGLFVQEIYGTRRREVLRLMMAEGPRFPHLAEFYYRNVVERALGVLHTLLGRAHARGELADDRLSRFPQLVMAPGLVAVLWSGLFDRFAPLDIDGLMRVHLDLLFGPGEEP